MRDWYLDPFVMTALVVLSIVAVVNMSLVVIYIIDSGGFGRRQRRKGRDS